MKTNYQKLIILQVLLCTGITTLAQTRALSLREALHEAAKGNRQLQMRSLENRKAYEAVKEAKSYLLPAVSANAGYSIYSELPVIYLRDENSSAKVNDVKYGGHFAFDGSITATYPLLHPALKSDIRSAGISEQIKKQETKNTEEQLALDISSLYLSILMNQEQQSVLQQSLQRNEQALKDSRSLFLQGKNLKTDTLRNYISVQNLNAALSALKSRHHVLEAQLKQLMGIEDSTVFELTDSLANPLSGSELLVLPESLSIAADMRRDVKIGSLQIEQAREQLDNARSSYKPQLWAVAAYQLQSQTDNFQFWQNGIPRTSYAGVKLNIPIYAGQRKKYVTNQSEIAIQQQELALTELKSSIRTELIALHADLEQAYRQWNIQQKNVEAAQVNYAMMNERYYYGLGTRLELTDAELALTNAKLGQLESLFSIRMIELKWKKATGTLQLL